ncbi:MAG: ABC transporter ATP-binding protein [Eubacteriales bacterium]
MIEIKNLTKKYSDNFALNDLNLTINDGEIFGLIGHNGAGKSTTIKALVSIIEPTSGEIYIDGEELSKNRVDCKKKIGYVSDTPDLFLKLSAEEYWDFIANAYGLRKEEKEARLNSLLLLFDLIDKRYDTIESFSHGMRQKVFVVGALISNPKIWILDEPMTGLDPQAAYDLKEMMRRHADAGNLVLFSTHVLEVAEKICDRIAILKKGELIYVGSIKELKNMHPEKTLEMIYLEMAGRQKED